MILFEPLPMSRIPRSSLSESRQSSNDCDCGRCAPSPLGARNLKRPSGTHACRPRHQLPVGFFVQTLQKTFDPIVTKVSGIVDIAVEILGTKVRDESEFRQAVEPISGR